MAVIRDRRFLLGILGAWLFASAIILIVDSSNIAQLRFPDVDDQLRLLQARDFLAGQSWFDVTQYRMNPPYGAPMHWSRLVDLPIAAVILLATPLSGSAAAETIAAVVVPLATLGVVMLLVALVTRRLLGPQAAILAALLSSTSHVGLQQLQPLRVDHHGWQIAFALATVLAILDDRPRRSGLAAGATLALWLQVSLEGLPFAAAAGAVVAIRWAWRGDPAESRRFSAFAASFAAGSVLLFVAMHAPAQWPTIYCDAVSPPHLAAFVIAAAGATAILRAPLAQNRNARFIGLAALGGTCLVAFRAIAPVCGASAFSQLEPRVYQLWYQNVLEGLPLWRQVPAIIVDAIVFPIVGLIGAVIGLRGADPAQRSLWLRYAALLAAAILIAILIERGGSAASMLAMPGAMAILRRLLAKAQANASMPLRVIGSSAAILAFSPTAPPLLWGAVGEPRDPPQRADPMTACATTANFRRLDILPPSIMLAGLDITPALLLDTHHRAIASGHHRNHSAMNDVIGAFVGTAAEAHAIVLRRRIDYVLVCPRAGEVDIYTGYAPGGFMAQLLRRPPAWLRRVIIPGAPGVHVWKVVG